jgi:uncharacterized membrane protein YoaK (UPF0700 family)
MAAAETRATLPLLPSLNAGYVDTAGFLALQGHFTARGHLVGILSLVVRLQRLISFGLPYQCSHEPVC